MAKYVVGLERTGSTSQSVGSLGCSSTTRRGRIGEAVFGSKDTPADAGLQWLVQRYTAAGTSTAVTPKPVDFADVACNAVAGQNHTVEPTYTAGEVMLYLPLNQRASFRWVAGPGYDWVWPATNASGFGIKTPTISTGTPLVTASLGFDE